MGITIRHNSSILKENQHYSFNSNSGYFGEHIGSAQHWVRTIYTDNPVDDARNMFKTLTNGARITSKAGGNVIHAELNDGTTIDLRINYPSGHQPAVQIDVRNSNDPAGISYQKVHFTTKK